MKLTRPTFGLMSGVATTLGLLPHLVVLLLLLVTGIPPRSIASLIVFTIGAKLLGEWLFWSRFIRRMDAEDGFKNWRSFTDYPLLKKPMVCVAFILILSDILLDTDLIYTALKIPIPPLWVFLSFLGCQALASPVQGVLSDYFNQNRSLLFAYVVSLLVALVSSEVSLETKERKAPTYSVLKLLGLSSLTPNVQILILLCSKGLLANTTIIARAKIAEAIKLETIQNSGEV